MKIINELIFCIFATLIIIVAYKIDTYLIKYLVILYDYNKIYLISNFVSFLIILILIILLRKSKKYEIN